MLITEIIKLDGDPKDEFYIGRDNGNILLARQLDWELQNEYALNISVTDGVHTVYTQVLLFFRIPSNGKIKQLFLCISS